MKNSSVAIVKAGRRPATGTLDVSFRVGDASQHSQRSHKIDFAYVTQITVEAYFEARAESQRRSGKQRSVEAGLIAGTIRFILGDFTFTFLVIGLIASGVALLRTPKPLTAPLIVDALFSYFLLFSLGFSLLYNFVLHTFLGEMTAAYIGWKDSPFQAEVGFASLGFAVVGLLAIRRSFDLRLAAVVGPALFFVCAGIAHIRQIVIAHNYAPGNAGLFLYMDFVIPLVGVVLLWLQHRYPIDIR